MTLDFVLVFISRINFILVFLQNDNLLLQCPVLIKYIFLCLANSFLQCNAKLKTDVMDGSGVMWITSNPLLKDDIEPFDKNTVATFRGER